MQQSHCRAVLVLLVCVMVLPSMAVRAQAWPSKPVRIVNAAVVKALQEPAVRSGLSSQGAIPVGNSPEEHDRYNRTEIEKWKKVAQTAGVTPE